MTSASGRWARRARSLRTVGAGILKRGDARGVGAMLGRWPAFGLSPEQEARFRQTHLAADIGRTRLCILLILVPLAGFAVNDYGFFGLAWPFFAVSAARLALLTYTVLLFRHLPRLTDHRDYDRVEFVWGLFFALFTVGIAATRPHAFIAHAVVAVLAVFVTLLAIPIRFALQLALSLIYTVGETLVVAPALQASPQATVTVLLSMLLANSIAVACGWQLHAWHRREFLAREEECLADAEAETQQAERRRAEGALRGSERRLRLALQGADGGVWDWNLRSGQAWWSDEMYALWDVEPGTPMRLENLLAVVHEQDREPLRRAIEDSIARRTDFRHEFRICHPVRGERWMASYGRLMDDDSGPAARLLGITLDVTDRKRAEEQLRQSTAELQAANAFLLDSRRAALNLMDDDLAARRRAEEVSAALRQEIAERKRAEDLLRLSETTVRQQLAEIEATYASAPIGLCVLDTDLRYVRVNERLAEINGLPAAAHLGRTFREVVPHVADQAEALMRRVIETGVPLLDVEIGGETGAQPGVRREWLEHWLPIKDIAGRVVGLNIVAEEVTERKRAEAMGRFLEEASGALAASLDYEATLQTVARMGASTLADGCVVDLIEAEWAGRRLVMVAGDPSLADLARELSGCYPIPPEGHPADRALRTGRPAFFAEVTDDALSRIAPGPEYLGRLRQAGIASMLIMPLKVHDRILGSIGLVTRGARRLTPDDVPALEEFARRASLAVERARLYEAERSARAYAEAAQSRLGLLVEASERLAESLLYEITLGNAARLLVPALADWCAIDLIQPDGRVRRSHVLAADPERAAALADAQREYSPSLAWTDHPISRVLLTQEPVLIDSPTVDDIRRSTRSPEHFEVIRRLNPRSLVIVPLVTRLRTIGAITLVMSESGRRHTPDDLGLAQEVARRAAMAVDNALLYREAQDAIRLREEFLSIASHELRTPMTVLRGDTEALNRILERAIAGNGLPKGEAAVSLDRNRLAGALGRMDRASQRMARLVEELLDMSRLKHGSLSLRPERMDLCALLIGVVEGTRQRLLSDSRTRAMALDLRLPECQSVWGRWDPGRLEQMLVNLIDNAVKYSPSDGVVGVEMALQPGNGQEPARRVHLVVCDQGIGIPPEERESIFEPFSRASNAAASNFPGLGLGLAISKEIVRLHGGRIWVESGGDGRGSQFHVVLPVVSSQ